MVDEFAGLSPKYRVFREPPWDEDIEPSVWAGYLAGIEIGPDGVGEKWQPLEPVEGFHFVLKPSTDRHAKTALIMYALMVKDDDEELCDALLEVLR